MEHILNYIKAAAVVVGGIVGAYIGGFDVALSVLVFLVVADYITGIIAAGYEGKIDSSVAFKCIPKKVLIFLMVAMAFQADRLVGTNNTLRMAVLFFYCGMEGISIMENSVRAGLPVPEILVKAFKQLNDKGDGDEVKLNRKSESRR